MIALAYALALFAGGIYELIADRREHIFLGGKG